MFSAEIFSAEITARLRAVLNEVCAGVSKYETGTRALVASKILENAERGDVSLEGLRTAGYRALASVNAAAA
jgi:hypothetical protein